MRGISEERLKEIASQTKRFDDITLLNRLVKTECQELQEPWMTLEEFLRSGFVGWCWIVIDNNIHIAYLNDGNFQFNDISPKSFFTITNITQIMPIHKPESPK